MATSTWYATAGPAGDAGNYIELKRIRASIGALVPPIGRTVVDDNNGGACNAANYTNWKKIDTLNCISNNASQPDAFYTIDTARTFYTIDNAASMTLLATCLTNATAARAATAANSFVAAKNDTFLPAGTAAPLYSTPPIYSAPAYVKNKFVCATATCNGDTINVGDAKNIRAALKRTRVNWYRDKAIKQYYS